MFELKFTPKYNKEEKLLNYTNKKHSSTKQMHFIKRIQPIWKLEIT